MEAGTLAGCQQDLYRLSFPTFRYILPFLAGRKVLDVGCNAGDYLSLMSKDSFGIDLDQVLLQRCREKTLNVLCANADMALPFESDTFDAVFASHVFEHLKAPINFLSEVYRALRPKGILVIGVPVEGGLAGLRSGYFSEHDGHLYSFSPDNLYRLLDYEGFAPVHTFFHIMRIGYSVQWAWLNDALQRLPSMLLYKISSAYWVISTRKC